MKSLVSAASSIFTLSLTFLASAAPAGLETRDIESRAARTTAPSGCLVVGSSGTYKTLGAALTELGSGTSAACIFMQAGTYNEQVTISYKGALTLYGSTADTTGYAGNKVIITSGKSRDQAGNLRDSSTVQVTSASFKAYNINFVNTFGTGNPGVALTASGAKQGYYGCVFKGYQDTLYAVSGSQYYKGCNMIGATDFIFGRASAWFEKCDISIVGKGYITANNRETTSDTSWYVFNNVNIAATVSGLAGQVYLGRPWRNLARVQYQNSQMTDIIAPIGWTTMSTATDPDPTFLEYKNTGTGSDTSKRGNFGKVASSAVAITTVLGSDYKSWIDTAY